MILAVVCWGWFYWILAGEGNYLLSGDEVFLLALGPCAYIIGGALQLLDPFSLFLAQFTPGFMRFIEYM
jgi:hypothetical protein